MTGNCPACGALGTPGHRCPACGHVIPTDAQVAQVARTGHEVMMILCRAALAGRTVTSDVIGGRLVLVEHYDYAD